MSQLINDVDRVWHFLRDCGVSVPYSAEMQGVGRLRDGELVGAVLYEGWSGPNIIMHAAGVDGHWISKDLLKTAFAYPFNQLGCKRITAWLEASNLKSQRLIEHLGFIQEATLEGAATDGSDVILYRMWKEDCRFI